MSVLLISADRTEPHGAPRNVGDALLTDALAHALQQRGESVVIYDFGAPRTSGGERRLRGNRLDDLSRAIRQHDAVVIGGGTLLQDNRQEWLSGSLPRMLAMVTLLARLHRRPVRFFAVGCDSLPRRAPRQALRMAVAGTPVWVRDSDSAIRFERHFGRAPAVAADASLLMQDSLGDMRSTRSGLVLALHRSHSPQVANALLDAWPPPATFLSMDQEVEDSDSDSLLPSVRDRLMARVRPIGWIDAATVVAGAQTVIASRMHALYLALMTGTPCVAVGRAEKIRSFVREFNVPTIRVLSDYTPGIEQIPDPAALTAAVIRVEGAVDDLVESLRHRDR